MSSNSNAGSSSSSSSSSSDGMFSTTVPIGPVPSRLSKHSAPPFSTNNTNARRQRRTNNNNNAQQGSRAASRDPVLRAGTSRMQSRRGSRVASRRTSPTMTGPSTGIMTSNHPQHISATAAKRMDDETYLKTFKISDLMSRLALAILEHKPADHSAFATTWVLQQKKEDDVGGGGSSRWPADKRAIGLGGKTKATAAATGSRRQALKHSRSAAMLLDPDSDNNNHSNRPQSEPALSHGPAQKQPAAEGGSDEGENVALAQVLPISSSAGTAAAGIHIRGGSRWVKEATCNNDVEKYIDGVQSPPPGAERTDGVSRVSAVSFEATPTSRDASNNRRHASNASAAGGGEASISKSDTAAGSSSDPQLVSTRAYYSPSVSAATTSGTEQQQQQQNAQSHSNGLTVTKPESDIADLNDLSKTNNNNNKADLSVVGSADTKQQSTNDVELAETQSMVLFSPMITVDQSTKEVHDHRTSPTTVNPAGPAGLRASAVLGVTPSTRTQSGGIPSTLLSAAGRASKASASPATGGPASSMPVGGIGIGSPSGVAGGGGAVADHSPALSRNASFGIGHSGFTPTLTGPRLNLHTMASAATEAKRTGTTMPPARRPATGTQQTGAASGISPQSSPPPPPPVQGGTVMHRRSESEQLELHHSTELLATPFPSAGSFAYYKNTPHPQSTTSAASPAPCAAVIAKEQVFSLGSEEYAELPLLAFPTLTTSSSPGPLLNDKARKDSQAGVDSGLGRCNSPASSQPSASASLSAMQLETLRHMQSIVAQIPPNKYAAAMVFLEGLAAKAVDDDGAATAAAAAYGSSMGSQGLQESGNDRSQGSGRKELAKPWSVPNMAGSDNVSGGEGGERAPGATTTLNPNQYSPSVEAIVKDALSRSVLKSLPQSHGDKNTPTAGGGGTNGGGVGNGGGQSVPTTAATLAAKGPAISFHRRPATPKSTAVTKKGDSNQQQKGGPNTQLKNTKAPWMVGVSPAPSAASPPPPPPPPPSSPAVNVHKKTPDLCPLDLQVTRSNADSFNLVGVQEIESDEELLSGVVADKDHTTTTGVVSNSNASPKKQKTEEKATHSAAATEVNPQKDVSMASGAAKKDSDSHHGTKDDTACSPSANINSSSSVVASTKHFDVNSGGLPSPGNFSPYSNMRFSAPGNSRFSGSADNTTNNNNNNSSAMPLPRESPKGSHGPWSQHGISVGLQECTTPFSPNPVKSSTSGEAPSKQSLSFPNSSPPTPFSMPLRTGMFTPLYAGGLGDGRKKHSKSSNRHKSPLLPESPSASSLMRKFTSSDWLAVSKASMTDLSSMAPPTPHAWALDHHSDVGSASALASPHPMGSQTRQGSVTHYNRSGLSAFLPGVSSANVSATGRVEAAENELQRAVAMTVAAAAEGSLGVSVNSTDTGGGGGGVGGALGSSTVTSGGDDAVSDFMSVPFDGEVGAGLDNEASAVVLPPQIPFMASPEESNDSCCRHSMLPPSHEQHQQHFRPQQRSKAELAVASMFDSFLTSDSLSLNDTSELDVARSAVASFSPLSSLDATQHEALVHAMDRRSWKKDDVILCEGEPSRGSLLLVVAGEVEVTRDGTHTATLAPGQFYGEKEMTSGQLEKSAVTLTVTSDEAVMYSVSKHDYKTLVVFDKDTRRMMFLHYLSTIPLLRSLPSFLQTQMADALRVCSFKEGDVLQKQGEPVEWMYLILSGSVAMQYDASSKGQSSMTHNPNNSETGSHNEDGAVGGGNDTPKSSPSPITACRVAAAAATDAHTVVPDMAHGCPNSLSSVGTATTTTSFVTIPDTAAPRPDEVGDEPQPQPPQPQSQQPQQLLHMVSPSASTTSASGLGRKQDYSTVHLNTRGVCGLVGEAELILQCCSGALCTALATTGVQAARMSRLHFEAIMSKHSLQTLQGTMLADPSYSFIERIAPEDVRRSIRQGRASAPSANMSPTDRRSSVTSLTRRSSHRRDSLVSILDAAEFNTSLTQNQKSLTAHPGTAARMLEDATGQQRMSSSHPMHPASSSLTGLDSLKRLDTTEGGISAGRRSSTGTTRWRHVSVDGEIIFSGSRNLYRFPAQCLRTNNTILIGVIVDGTIIRWNSIAQKVTGYAPFEVIGQNIFDILWTDESRQRMRNMMELAKNYAGNWEGFVKMQLDRQEVFPFRQNMGFYQIGVALSVVPSIFSSSAEVVLLIGREAKYRAAANYASDVAKWLEESLKPQLQHFQRRVSKIALNNWIVTADDAMRLRGHLDACASLVEQFTRFSQMNMDNVNETWRPLRLPALIRRFAMEATAMAARQGNFSFYCNTDEITPRAEVFLDAPQVVSVLRLLLQDATQEYHGSVEVNIELRVIVVEPEEHSRNVQPQQQQQQQQQTAGAATATRSGSPPLQNKGVGIAGVGGATTTGDHNNPMAADMRSAATSQAGSHQQQQQQGTTVDKNKSQTAFLTSVENIVSAQTQRQTIDVSPNSLRRIRLEMRDNGPTIPSLRSPLYMDVDVDEVTGRSDTSSRVSPTTNVPLAPFNSPVHGGAEEFPPGCPPRGTDLQQVEKIVTSMGGMLYGFTRPEVEGNVIRVELPLLTVPGSKEEEYCHDDELGTMPTTTAGRNFTVIVAENNRMHQNYMCQILWSRQHAVVPVTSFKELMRKMDNNADILIIDPIQLDITAEDYDNLQGEDPFEDITMYSSRMVVIVMGTDFSDWRVQKLLDRNSVIELPKLGSGALIHIAMQEAEQMVTEMREEEERIEVLRRTFTSSAAGRHKVGRLLGKGTFGDVYEVEDTLTGGKMAMKRMQLHDGVFADEVVQEILAMTSLQHENIIHYFYCEKESDALLRLYMELAPGGTLRNKVRQTPGVGLPFDQYVQHLTDICRGLAYVHAQRYVHADIKTANLLIGSRGRTKIGDFGTAKQIRPGQKLYALMGTPQYMAPEVLTADEEAKEGYDFKADIWSVGCVALEMATGMPPFAHLEQTHGMGIIKYLSELTDTPDLSPLFSGNPLIYEFVKGCLEVHPENRPTAQELFHFDILQGAVTSIRAERIVKRAEMLYKLNKYAAMQQGGGGHDDDMEDDYSDENDGDDCYDDTDSNQTDDYNDILGSEGGEEETDDDGNGYLKEDAYGNRESDFFSSTSSTEDHHGGDASHSSDNGNHQQQQQQGRQGGTTAYHEQSSTSPSSRFAAGGQKGEGKEETDDKEVVVEPSRLLRPSFLSASGPLPVQNQPPTNNNSLTGLLGNTAAASDNSLPFADATMAHISSVSCNSSGGEGAPTANSCIVPDSLPLPHGGGGGGTPRSSVLSGAHSPRNLYQLPIPINNHNNPYPHPNPNNSLSYKSGGGPSTSSDGPPPYQLDRVDSSMSSGV